MKDYSLLRTLVRWISGGLLGLHALVGYGLTPGIGPAGAWSKANDLKSTGYPNSIVSPKISFKAENPLSSRLPTGTRPNTPPVPDVADREIEACWGDAAIVTVISLDGVANAPLPAGASFACYSKNKKGLFTNITTTTNPAISVPMPTTAMANIPMEYYIAVVARDPNAEPDNPDVPSEYGEEVPITITWHYISNSISVDAGSSGAAPYLQNYPVQFVAAAGSDSYVWNWGDSPNTTTTTNSNTIVHYFPQAGSYNISVTITTNYDRVPGGYCSTVGTINGFLIVTPLCEMPVRSTGQFQQNTHSGAISFVPPAGSCLPVGTLECLSEDITPTDTLDIRHVVAATATLFTDQIPATPPVGITSANPYLAGQWRTTPQASYSYRTSLTPDLHNYSAGTFSLRPFDWEGSLRARPAAWLTAAVTEKVSVQGDVLQERDPLGIPSAAKFSYGTTPAGTSAQILPYLQAHNAEYSTVFFESFENVHTVNRVMTGEDGFVIASNNVLTTCDAQSTTCPVYAHTGNSCLQVMERRLALMSLPLTTQINSEGLLVKVWVHYQRFDNTPTYMTDADVSSQITFEVVQTQASSYSLPGAQLVPVAQTGDWILLEARIPMSGTGLNIGDILRPVMYLSAPQFAWAWVDDIRVQPATAQMTAYVYDPTTLRLVASFDDQHFALRYQYNAEGKLIRKQADTERGIKTLQETHYHTPSTTQVDD